MKTALWILLVLALMALFLWFGPIDFAGAGEPDSFCCVLWADGGDPLLNWPNAGGKPRPELVGDSLSDIVHDSEGGQMPSREEFDRRSTGDTYSAPDGRSDSEGRPDGQDSGSAPTVEPPSMKEGESDTGTIPGPDSTPPGGSESGAAGRALAPPHVIVFMGWSERGDYLVGKVFDTAEDCETQRDQDRERHPRVMFSACTEIPAVRDTL